MSGFKKPIKMDANFMNYSCGPDEEPESDNHIFNNYV